MKEIEKTQNQTYLTPSPRRIPFLLLLRLYCGGFTNQFGWLFFGVGLIFFWIFEPITNLKSLYKFSGELDKVEGLVLSWEETNIKENNEQVYFIRYSFKLPNGQQYFGESYSTGEYLVVNSPVIVEYPKGDPSISRIEGMRTSKLGILGIFVVFFPMAGLAFIIKGLKNGRKAHRLLKWGKLTHGQLNSKVETNMKINKRPVYKLSFEFIAEDGTKYNAIAKTHLPKYLEDEKQERLVYDPTNPVNSVLLDSLPASPIIDETGNFNFASNIEIVKAITGLIVPISSLIGHGIYIYNNFLLK